MYFELAQDIGSHEEPAYSSERARVCASPRCKVWLLLAISSEVNSEKLIFHCYFSILRSTSLIFSACPICSISLSFGSVEAELRVEYDGLAAANEVVDFVAPACRDHPVTILDPCCEAIRKELAATRSRTLAEFWVSWDGPSWST